MNTDDYLLLAKKLIANPTHLEIEANNALVDLLLAKFSGELDAEGELFVQNQLETNPRAAKIWEGLIGEVDESPSPATERLMRDSTADPTANLFGKLADRLKDLADGWVRALNSQAQLGTASSDRRSKPITLPDGSQIVVNVNRFGQSELFVVATDSVYSEGTFELRLKELPTEFEFVEGPPGQFSAKLLIDAETCRRICAGEITPEFVKLP